MFPFQLLLFGVGGVKITSHDANSFLQIPLDIPILLRLNILKVIKLFLSPLKKFYLERSHYGSVVTNQTMRTWVQSLTLLSRLRIWRCHELWCRSKT